MGDAGGLGRVCSEQSSTLATVSYYPDLNGHTSLKPSLDDSPVANQTRSKARQTDFLSSSFCKHVTPVSSKKTTVSDLHLPVSLQNVTKYHEDCIKNCEDQDTANKSSS